MAKQNILLKKVNQTGSMMIEALAMLTLISLVTPTLYKKSAERTTELQDINTATHVRTLVKAVDNYTSAEYQTILEEMKNANTDTAVVNVDDLRNYLPYGYHFQAVKNFDAPIVTVKRQGDGNSLTSFVVFPKTGDVNDLRASRIASMVGSNGGFIDHEGNAKGVGGIWGLTREELEDQLEKSDRAASAVSGSLVASSAENINEASRAAFENSKYLQRTEAPNEEWRNTMMTDLYMGGVKNILAGNEPIPMSKILGVDQLIIGDIKTSADENETTADLVVKKQSEGRSGAAFIEGSLRALGNTFSVSGTKDNPELNFADNLLKATSDQFSVNILDSEKPDFVIDKPDESSSQATFNVATKVDGTFETVRDTTLASGSEAKLYVGPDGRIMEAEDGLINMLQGSVVVRQAQDDGDDDDDGENGDVSEVHISTAEVNIDGTTTIGQGEEEPLINNLNPNLNVQGNAFVSGQLEAGEVDAHRFDALELSAGGKDYEKVDQDKYNRWLNVNKDGVVIRNIEEEDQRPNRLVINTDDTSIYGPTFEDADNKIYKAAITMGDTVLSESGAKKVQIYTQDKRGEVALQGGAIKATGVAEDGAGNLVDIRAARLQVAGSDDRNVAFEIIPGEGSDPRSVSSAVADVDQFVVQKGGNKLLNIVSGENNTELRGDSVAEIDPERFRIWSKTPEGDDVNNRVFEVNAVTGEMNKNGAISSPASVYIRRGAIELEGSPNSGATYKADEGVGYIEASRFVANNLQSDGHSVIEPRYANTSGYDTGVQHDRYMVNPAYTSVMHDIKLTTRGGARLSDILPDFINKGIYIVNNTYKDGINFNDLTITNDGGVIKATEATEIATTFTGENQWASPFMGMVPAPQCPPGHARVITITPASFQMAQTGDMVLNSDGRYYVQENAKANDLTDVTGVHSNGEVTGAILQPAHEIVKGVNPDGTPQIDYIYYLGLGNEPSITKNGQPYSPKPLYFQQSTWLKSKVIAYGNKNCKTSVAENGGCANFMGWATVMGFIYPYELYGPIINSLQGKPAVSKTEDALANQKVYWNVFPVRTGSMEAYATVYCYFDRTNIFGSGNDSSYVDQYDQLHNFRDVYKKTNAGTRNGSQPGTNENYLKRLNDPHLKYNDPW